MAQPPSHDERVQMECLASLDMLSKAFHRRSDKEGTFSTLMTIQMWTRCLTLVLCGATPLTPDPASAAVAVLMESLAKNPTVNFRKKRSFRACNPNAGNQSVRMSAFLERWIKDSIKEISPLQLDSCIGTTLPGIRSCTVLLPRYPRIYSKIWVAWLRQGRLRISRLHLDQDLLSLLHLPWLITWRRRFHPLRH